MSDRYIPTPAVDDPHHSWTRPLEFVEHALRLLPSVAGDELFACADFMTMGRIASTNRPDIVLYKHVVLRSYLNVDATGQTYRFVPPKRSSRVGYGTYRPHRSLRHAIDLLGLVDLRHLMPARSIGVFGRRSGSRQHSPLAS